MKQNKYFAVTTLVLTVMAIICAWTLQKETDYNSLRGSSPQSIQVSLKTDVLSYWTEGSEARDELISYVEDVTDENSPDFIPVEDRIAVFDFDGTLFCETDPDYFDYELLRYRVLEDPTYVDQASDFEISVAEQIVTLDETGEAPDTLPVDHGKAVASAFAGMTLDEFDQYVQEFKQQKMPSYSGMKRGDGWYLPMLQVIDYLQENDFKVFIMSGTDRYIVRGIFEDSPLNIPPSQIIGSDMSVEADNQDGADGLSYVYSSNDKVVLGGDFIVKDLKMNKVSAIEREIGQQPVLSFGNSSGDYSMAEYVITDNPYRSLAFMLCCDDLVRENGNMDKANTMYAACDKNGWIPVSMRDDWTTIYGDNVVRITAESSVTK